MAHTLTIHGGLDAKPTAGNASACPTVTAPIDEMLSLSKPPLVAEYELTADAAQAVSFGGLTQANVVMIKTVGGKVTATLSSADGASQDVPVDSYLLIISSSVPYTALSVTRAAGVTTTAKILLAERT